MMQLRKTLGFVAVCLLAAVLLPGCGEKNPRKEVKGKITLKGAPLDEGVIEFAQISKADPSYPATQAGAVVKNGVYSIPADAGLVPGKYKVVLTAGDSKSPASADQMPGPSGNYVMKDRIPPEYNVKSDKEVEVTEKGPNEFNFDVP